MSNIEIKREDRKAVGIEVEALLLNPDGEIIVPPATFPRDGFPIFVEIQAGPGSTVVETVANYHKARLELQAMLREGHSLLYRPFEQLSLKLYREANRQMAGGHKNEGIRNIYGTDISDFSDQVVKDGRIQGTNISCGLHIHFSYETITRITIPEFVPVVLPMEDPIEGRRTIELYRKTDKAEHTEEVKINDLKLPVIEAIVRRMDELCFDKFKIDDDKRTKYRQPGFYRLKPYGFEYRSLPACPNTTSNEALMFITKCAFDAMRETLCF